MDITFDASQISRYAEFFRLAPDIVQEEMLRAVTESDLLVQGELMQFLPKGAGGTRGAGLANSVFTEEHVVDQGVLGTVATSKQYASYVEIGTRPHAPPIQPLKDWAEVKLGLHGDDATGAAFAISKTIAKRGTKAQPVWQDTYQRILPTVQKKLEAGLDRVAARLAQVPS